MRINDLSEVIETSRWDIALEALLNETFSKNHRIDLEILSQLSKQFSIRFEDLVVTLFELTFCEQWQYMGTDGVPRILKHQDLDKLYLKRRIYLASARHLLTGYWQPLANKR